MNFSSAELLSGHPVQKAHVDNVPAPVECDSAPVELDK